MPDINNKLDDVKNQNVFRGIDYRSGHWQLPMVEKVHSLHAWITPQGVVQLTRTLQGVINSGDNFQQKNQTLFCQNPRSY